MRLSEAELQAVLGKPGYRVEQGQAPPPMAEGALLGQVRRLALEHGYLYYHTYSSRRSDLGFPDCVLCKPGHPLYLWELKSATGKLTREQETWLALLGQVTGVQAAVYRPADWDTIYDLLTRRR